MLWEWDYIAKGSLTLILEDVCAKVFQWCLVGFGDST